MDRIHINGLEIYAYHGVFPEEKEKGQPFVLDITLELEHRVVRNVMLDIMHRPKVHHVQNVMHENKQAIYDNRPDT